MLDKTLKQNFPFDYLLEYESFLSILKYYVDLNCFVIPLNPADTWLAINYHHRLASVFDLEKKYGFVRKWNKIFQPGFWSKRKGNQSYLQENFGFYDICVPIKQKGKLLGVLLSGAFADRELTYSHLQKSWNQLSSQTASPENPAFREFAQVALETPVLEENLLKAYGEALQLFVRILTRENIGEGVYRRLKELNINVFSKQLPHSFWMNWALGLPTQQAAPPWNRKVQELDWVRDEIGINRIPTTVIAVIPVKSPGKKTDAVEEMLRVKRFQRRSFHFARTLPQTVGGKLENYGAIFATSADLTKNRLQRRRQIADTAERIHQFAVKELGGPALVGIGDSVAPGEGLNNSYRQAVLALHLGRQSGREYIFFNPVRAQKAEGFLELKRLLLHLKRQFELAAFSDMELVLDDFLKQVLTLSLSNPEEIRWHLQYALIQLVETVRGRMDLREEEIHTMHEGIILTLEKAGTVQEMLLCFKEALKRLMDLALGKERLATVNSMEKVRDYVDGHFRDRLKILQLARIAGVSVSTFSRRFKKSTGVGLETYLQNLRLEEACRMLRAGGLPISIIAKTCGFRFASYFSQLFRRKMRLSPQQYRMKSKNN